MSAAASTVAGRARTFVVAQKVRGLIGEIAGVDMARLGDDAALGEELGLDALEIIDLALACDDAFAIDLDDDTIEGFVTVGDVIAAVTRAFCLRWAPA